MALAIPLRNSDPMGSIAMLVEQRQPLVLFSTNLKKINGLKSDRIIVGQQLRIPFMGTPGTKSDLAGLHKAQSRYAEADLFVLPRWRTQNRR